MKLWILSDLHVDANRRFPFELPIPRPAHDIVVIAGDICQGLAEGVRFIASEKLNAKPVVYVGGNHEFYGHNRHAELAEGRAEAARHPNIHVLERDRISIGGVAFLGCTLWTDYRYAGAREQVRAMHWAARRISDHRLIADGKGAWSPERALAEHLGSRAWLAEQLARDTGRRPIVVTHHAPSRQSVQPRYRDDLLTAAFASDLDDLVTRATLWVHGHLHAPVDYRLGGCRVVANPRGYVSIREGRDFNPSLVVTAGAG
ncbi:MAG: metallophosphoesterase [Hyphomonadaceae bacterium]|jgi:predicted phosphodiesterase|nr:metallophosphoesterase [Hyphomonadaceae bacterium]